MHVSAKDLATGREQKMTVTGGSALPRNDIDRLVREAEQYAEEDRRRREAAETRNHGEQLVYQTEKFVRENDERVPAETQTEVASAAAELKQLLEDSSADTAALRGAIEKLATVSQQMGQAMYARAQQQTPPEDQPPTGHAPGEDEGVVDAEIVDEDRDGNTKDGAA
jgi:molecular chaperone DnaK